MSSPPAGRTAKSPRVNRAQVRSRSPRGPKGQSAADPNNVELESHNTGRRKSTQVGSEVVLLAYKGPKRKKDLRTLEDCWVLLLQNMQRINTGVDNFFGRSSKPLTSCSCSALEMSANYRIVALNIPREVIHVMKRRRPKLKLVTQMKGSASEIAGLCRLIFRCLVAEAQSVLVSRAEGKKVSTKTVPCLKFYFKQLLRIVNHWNYSHADKPLPAPLQQEIFDLISTPQLASALGTVYNEILFLSEHLNMPLKLNLNKSVDPAATADAAKAEPATALTATTLMTLIVNSASVSELQVNDAMRRAMLTFAEEKFAHENTLFWMYVECFRNLPMGERAPMLRRIREKFLENSSPLEVNLSSKRKNALMEAIDAGQLDDSIFHGPKKEVQQQLKVNVVSPFVEQLFRLAMKIGKKEAEERAVLYKHFRKAITFEKLLDYEFIRKTINGPPPLNPVSAAAPAVNNAAKHNNGSGDEKQQKQEQEQQQQVPFKVTPAKLLQFASQLGHRELLAVWSDLKFHQEQCDSSEKREHCAHNIIKRYRGQFAAQLPVSEKGISEVDYFGPFKEWIQGEITEHIFIPFLERQSSSAATEPIEISSLFSMIETRKADLSTAKSTTAIPIVQVAVTPDSGGYQASATLPPGAIDGLLDDLEAVPQSIAQKPLPQVPDSSDEEEEDSNEEEEEFVYSDSEDTIIVGALGI